MFPDSSKNKIKFWSIERDLQFDPAFHFNSEEAVLCKVEYDQCAQTGKKTEFQYVKSN
jgi:hemerythrin